ncbi:hypothetical protein V6N13_046956 [Hibiscus sabdariffa]
MSGDGWLGMVEVRMMGAGCFGCGGNSLGDEWQLWCDRVLLVVNEGIGDDSVALALGGGCGFDVSPWWCGSLLRVGFGEAHNGGRSCVRLELVSGG